MSALTLNRCMSAGSFCQLTSASQSFPVLISTEFGAQVQVTAWSGAGLTKNKEAPALQSTGSIIYGTPTPNLPEIYTRADGSIPDSVYDPKSYIPQVTNLVPFLSHLQLLTAQNGRLSVATSGCHSVKSMLRCQTLDCSR